MRRDEVEWPLDSEAITAFVHEAECVVRGAVLPVKDELVVADEQKLGLRPVGRHRATGGEAGGGDDGAAQTVEGLPVIQSAAAPVGRAWVVGHAQVLTVLRGGGGTVAVSSDAYFSSDRVAVRATMRVGFGFPASARLAVIALDGEPIAA